MVPGALVLLIGWLWDHSFVLQIILWVVTLDFTGSEKNWVPLFFPRAQSFWIMCLTQGVDRCIIRLLSWLLVNILVAILVECQWRVGQESVDSRSIHRPSGVPLSVNRGSSVGWQIDWLSVTIASVVRWQCIAELDLLSIDKVLVVYWSTIGIACTIFLPPLSTRLFPLLLGTCELTHVGHYCLLLISAVADTRLISYEINMRFQLIHWSTPPIRHMIHLVYAAPFTQGQNTPKSTPKVYEK